MIAAYLVTVILTFADGSYVEYNNGNWDVAKSYEECQSKIASAANELKEKYKDATDPKPSTFMLACIEKK